MFFRDDTTFLLPKLKEIENVLLRGYPKYLLTVEKCTCYITKMV